MCHFSFCTFLLTFILLLYPSFFSFPVQGVHSLILVARGSDPTNSCKLQDQSHWCDDLQIFSIKKNRNHAFGVCLLIGWGGIFVVVLFFSFRARQSLKLTVSFSYPSLCDVKVSKERVFIL